MTIYQHNDIKVFHGVGNLPLVGDSRCNPAFSVAAAWREIDGCLAGEDERGLSPFKALESSPSGAMLSSMNCTSCS
jgi:hypothetical protein